MLKFFNFTKRNVIPIMGIDNSLVFGDSGLAVSPDGQGILHTQIDRAGSDIMLVTNFR